MIQYREARMEDGLAILANLRPQEQKTIDKLKLDAVATLAKALANQFPSFTVFVDGVPAAIFGGHSETLVGECRLWMLTTPLIEAHQIPLLRASRKYVQWMFDNYGPVVGMVDSEFDKSRRWLRWIGFKEVQDGEYIVMRYSGGH
jgi:hypothetical protein